MIIALCAITARAQEPAPSLDYVCMNGTANVPWRCMPIVTNMTPPYTFRVDPTQGPLPSWMSLDATTGILSGTPPNDFVVTYVPRWPNPPSDINAAVQ